MTPNASPSQPKTGSFLKDLDYSVVQQCMHCGMCLPTCPTYDKTKLERNSPRGRISLMRSIADGEIEATKAFADEMYYCLGCLACMTACPAGVNYAELFEMARAESERVQVLNHPRRNVIRWFTLKWLFMDHERLKILGALMRLYQQCGLQWLVRNSGIMKLMPKRLRELESMTPTIQPQFTDELVPLISPARGEKKYRVAVLIGCAQDLIFSDVNRDTVEVLTRNGCEVVTSPAQSCCGSLHAHNGEWDQAKILARRMIDAVPPEEFDAVITNAAGCGSHLKHYSNLLHDDPIYAPRAKAWDATVKDIHEWLDEIGVAVPSIPNPEPQCVTYHEACHLCHGQKITRQPRNVLKAIPGLELRELPESNWCCGSAGIYNIVQPEMAGELLERKVGKIRETGATTVATGNPGCLLQIQNGVRQAEIPARVVHPVSLLAEAYRKESQSSGRS